MIPTAPESSDYKVTVDYWVPHVDGSFLFSEVVYIFNYCSKEVVISIQGFVVLKGFEFITAAILPAGIGIPSLRFIVDVVWRVRDDQVGALQFP